ncbi:MAG TPA: hypothetical protein PLD63_09615 [Ignavibacteria bacterium]|nr:hypothetical protein [Ignavibacteria bacterium]
MIEYLNKFSSEEVLRFEKFVKSPFYNSNKNLLKLTDFLIALYPDINKKNSSKSVISSKVFNEKKINDVKIRKLMSDFNKVIDRFIMQIEFESDNVRNRILLLNSLRKRGMDKRFEYDFNEFSKSQKNLFSKDEDYYNNEVNLLSEYYSHNQSKYKNIKAEILQEKSDNIDMRFIFEKLHTFHEMFDNEGSRNRDKFFNRTFYEEIKSYIENNLKNVRDEHPNIYIIYLVLKMNETFNDDYLDSLLKFLKANQKKFTNYNLVYYYNYITAYYNKKINVGHIKYRKDLIKLYMRMMKNDLFLIDNIITDFEYNNVVNIALAEGKYDWIDDFIETYKIYLEKTFAEDIYNLAKAKLLFHSEKYDNIFEYLNKVDIKDPTYYINSKFLLGRVYFEKDEDESIQYILDNLLQYKRNKKILSEEQQKSIQLYLGFMNDLMKISNCPELEKDRKKSLKAIMRKELSNPDGFIPARSWFYEKLEKV